MENLSWWLWIRQHTYAHHADVCSLLTEPQQDCIYFSWRSLSWIVDIFFGWLGVCLFSGFVRLSLLLSFRFAALQGWMCPDKRGYAKISKISCYFHPNTEYNVSKLVSYFYLFLKRVRIQSLQYISNKS